MVMTLAYRVDGEGLKPEYICVDCYEDGLVDDWYEGMQLTQITDPNELPEGPSGLGRECDSPFCEERLPTRDDLERTAQILREARDIVFGLE